MVERFLLTCPSPTHRAALEVVALVRTTDQAILRPLVSPSEALMLLEWLSSLSFIQPTEQGLFPHDSVRQALHQTLLTQHPERHLELFSKAKLFYTEQIKQTSGPAQQRWMVEDVFLHRLAPQP
jgi:hypothetical protein